MPPPVQLPALAKPPRVPHAEPAPVRDIDITQSCDTLKESLQVLAGKYSLDAFTIATADGLVFASTGSATAQADAAYYNRYTDGKDPAGMTIFGLTHKGSDLTAIIRSSSEISPDVRKRIENDTKDILNWWI